MKNVTCFNYYYRRRYNRIPLPQVALDFQRQHGQTFAEMVFKAIRDAQNA